VSVINDGGSAFPFGDYQNGGEQGMTLRDYFAAAALPSVINGKNFFDQKACEFDIGKGHLTWGDAYTLTDAETMSKCAESCAIAAYNFADAMLAARKEGA